jgi:hypothetical protein
MYIYIYIDRSVVDREERLSDMQTLNTSFTARWRVLCLIDVNFWAGTKYNGVCRGG